MIAVAILAFGDNWTWALVIFQVIFSTLAITYFCNLIRITTKSQYTAVFGCAAIAGSVSFVWDNFLLTDSLHASLLIILYTALIRNLIQPNPPASMLLIFGIGMLLVPALLLRDITLYIAVFIAPVVLFWTYSTTPNLIKSVALTAIFYLPLAATVTLYISWNSARSDEAFITTSSRTAVMVPLLRMEAAGEPIFDQDTPLDTAATRTLREIGIQKALATTYGVMEHVYATNRILTENYDMNSVEVARAVSGRFISVVLTKPMTILRYLTTQLRPAAVFRLFFQPVYSVTATYEIKEGRTDIGSLSRFSPLIKRISNGDYIFGHALLLVAEGLSRIAAIILAAGFLILFPSLYLLNVAKRKQPPQAIWLVCWVIPFGTAILYGMVHFEPRYLMATVPLAVLISLVTIKNFFSNILGQLSQH